MTLRLRLLLVMVGIVTAGLVISDVVTYNALRSFLTTRVDQQLEAAAYPVGRALLSSSGLGLPVPAAPPPGSTSGTTATQPGGSTTTTLPTTATRGLNGGRTVPGDRSFRGAFRNGGGLFSSAPGTQRGLLVTPGTYGQLRSSSGRVEAHLFFSYGGKAPTAPVLPAKLPGAGLASTTDHFFDTSSAGAQGVHYRVLAKPLSDGTGVIVVAVPLSDLDSTLRQLLFVELIVSALLLVGLGIVSWVMVRRDLRPLQEMTETAGVIAHGDLSQRVSHVNEATEVGKLGTAFNTMVDEIEVAFAERAASEERLRRFLADASHELRTPLTSILGYAELFDLGIRDRPEDLAVSLRTIKAEATRMGTLVDDLLLLAQLDEERPLRREPVDLADVARRSADGIGVSAPDRPVTVSVDRPVVVLGDEDRLRQVVDNLMVNAVIHTPPGIPVEVGVSEEGGLAVLTVHDAGPGIDAGELGRIFRPFYRPDPSRARASGGAGLGLAIVAAIVESHGGTVGVDSGAGRGTTFEVRLPVGPVTALPGGRAGRGEPGPVDQEGATAPAPRAVPQVPVGDEAVTVEPG